MSKDAFNERLNALGSRLADARRAIGATEIDRAFHARAADELMRRLDDLMVKVDSQRRLTNNLGLQASAWQTLRAYSDECAPLFGECLAFVHAGIARRLDSNGVCAVADTLLDTLARNIPNVEWGRFSIMATDEFFVDLVQIVRVRFPADGIWDLPVAAHEFGHFISGRLNRSSGGARELPFEVYKAGAKGDAGQSDATWRAYLEEYFADVYATFALGPSYACSCLLLRFDPARANAETDGKHPAFSKRAYVILQTLRRMSNEKNTQGHFSQWAASLEQKWLDAAASAGQPSPWLPAGPPNAERTRTDVAASEFYEILKSTAPAARYTGRATANKAADLLKKPAAVLDPEQFSCVDLLNAAWICRGAPGSDAAALSSRVLDLCRVHAGVARVSNG